MYVCIRVCVSSMSSELIYSWQSRELSQTASKLTRAQTVLFFYYWPRQMEQICQRQTNRQTDRQIVVGRERGAWQLRTKSNCCCPVNFLRNNFVHFILFCILRGQITQVWPKLARAACSCSFAICTYISISNSASIPYTIFFLVYSLTLYVVVLACSTLSVCVCV